jgi:hypothetical protein
MLRLLATGFVLSTAAVCSSANSSEFYQPRSVTIGDRNVRLVVECSQSRLTIDNPDDTWNHMEFRCDNGQIRVAGKNDQ